MPLSSENTLFSINHLGKEYNAGKESLALAVDQNIKIIRRMLFSKAPYNIKFNLYFRNFCDLGTQERYMLAKNLSKHLLCWVWYIFENSLRGITHCVLISLL